MVTFSKFAFQVLGLTCLAVMLSVAKAEATVLEIGGEYTDEFGSPLGLVSGTITLDDSSAAPSAFGFSGTEYLLLDFEINLENGFTLTGADDPGAIITINGNNIQDFSLLAFFLDGSAFGAFDVDALGPGPQTGSTFDIFDSISGAVYAGVSLEIIPEVVPAPAAALLITLGAAGIAVRRKA